MPRCWYARSTLLPYFSRSELAPTTAQGPAAMKALMRSSKLAMGPPEAVQCGRMELPILHPAPSGALLLVASGARRMTLADHIIQLTMSVFLIFGVYQF